MFGTVDLWTYVVATVLIILLPGPNSLYVLSVASRKGRRAGVSAAAGVFCGDSVLMVASAAGLASMFAASPVLYGLIRWAGVVYLAILAFGLIRGGWKTWRAARRGEPLPEVALKAGPVNERPFIRALIASLLNPKAILFFVAFFIQFVDPAYAWPVLSYGVLFVILQVFSVAYLSTLIVAGDGLAQTFRRRRKLAAAGNGLVGAVMIGFAAKLATGWSSDVRRTALADHASQQLLRIRRWRQLIGSLRRERPQHLADQPSRGLQGRVTRRPKHPRVRHEQDRQVLRGEVLPQPPLGLGPGNEVGEGREPFLAHPLQLFGRAEIHREYLSEPPVVGL